MTRNDKDTELYDKAEKRIEQKPEFAEGETYGQVTISDVEDAEKDRSSESSDTTFEEFNQAEDLIVEKPSFAEGETWGEIVIPDEGKQNQTDPVETEDTPIFTDTEPLNESVPDDPDHDHPQEHIGLMPLIRPDHPL